MPESSGKLDPFPSRLKAAREARGFSQAELAERSGLQPSAVSHFETGRRAPSLHNLRRLADALDVTIDFLLGRNQESLPEVELAFRDFERLSPADRDKAMEIIRVIATGKKKRKPGEQEDER